MNIEACFERDTFQARERCNLVLGIRCSEEIVPGEAIEMQLPNSWCLVTGPSYTRAFQAVDPAAPHHISVFVSDRKVRFDISIVPRQLNYPEGASRHGRLIRAELTEGIVPPNTPIRLICANTFAPYVAERETLWLRVRNETPAETPVLNVTPGPAESLRVIAPSAARPGKPFDVLIVSLDRFENVSSTVYGPARLELVDGAVVAHLLHFVGRARVPVVLEREGVYRLRFGDTLSNAVRVSADAVGPFWGDLHIHTKLSHDAQGTDPYGYARDVSGLHFAAACDHWESLGREGYLITRDWAREAHAPGRFVSIPADERNPRGLTGHHNIYFRDEDTFIGQSCILPDGGKPDSQEQARALGELDPAKAMIVPHHTGIAFGGVRRQPGGEPVPGGSQAVDWDAWPHRDKLCPLVEIYSHHGQSERYDPQHVLAYEFNRMRNPERRANTSSFGPYYAQDYWKAGHRFGVIGSSDEHSGQGGRRHGGVAAVWAPELTRDGLWDAMFARRTYATTGERILMEFTVGDGRMGEAVRVASGARLPVRLRVWGTDLLLRVEILRFRFGVDRDFHPVLSEAPRPESLDMVREFEESVEGPCMYYARVTQEPVAWPGMAWSSPVWVDTESREDAR